jgi:hypothetical protein
MVRRIYARPSSPPGRGPCRGSGGSNGIVLVKCQDYISSGKLWPGTHPTLTCALDLGFRFEDRFEHVMANPRPQPLRKQQVHAHRNLSTLFVFRKVRP